MKKLLFLLLIVGLGNINASGQDTVRYLDPWYKFNPMPALSSTSYHDYPITQQPSHHLMEHYYTFDTLYGIAFTFTQFPEQPERIIALCFRNVVYERLDVFLSNNSVAYISQMDVDTIFWARPPLMKQCKFEYEFTLPSPSSSVVNCFEFYFDEPISNAKDSTSFVNDTFFVGRNWDWSLSEQNSTIVHPEIDHFIAGYDPTFSQRQIFGAAQEWFLPSEDFICSYPEPDPSYVEDVDNNQVFIRVLQNWGMAFPIIKLRCTAPRWQGVSKVDGVYTAVWNADADAEMFQLSMCEGDQRPEEGVIVNLSEYSYAVGDWILDSTHHLYLRKQCDYSTPSHSRQVWSDWSRMDNPKVDSEEDGIATVAALDFELLPNPAQERVTVRCAQAEGGTVSVVDMQGRTLLTQAAKATTVLDISTLPDGPYLVRIVTPTGTATRKLSVVR